MSTATELPAQPEIIEHAPISTWFRVGGTADRFARPESAAQLRRCVEMDRDLMVLGEGANLLVSDEGVRELVVSLDRLDALDIDADSGLVRVGAGARLPKVITACVNAGLGGLETIAGIPASIGGAVAMNAGGSFGQIGDVVESVTTMDREGVEHERSADELGFAYRHTNLSEDLSGEIVTSATVRLTPGDPQALKDRLVEVMGYKKNTQPMGERSAGCAFRNPTLGEPIDGIGDEGERVSAGLLIDRAGCKGLVHGSALVSELHGNFITTRDGACAGDVIGLMVEVAGRVRDRFGVTLKPEVVIWRRTAEEAAQRRERGAA